MVRNSLASAVRVFVFLLGLVCSTEGLPTNFHRRVAKRIVEISSQSEVSSWSKDFLEPSEPDKEGFVRCAANLIKGNSQARREARAGSLTDAQSDSPPSDEEDHEESEGESAMTNGIMKLFTLEDFLARVRIRLNFGDDLVALNASDDANSSDATTEKAALSEVRFALHRPVGNVFNLSDDSWIDDSVDETMANLKHLGERDPKLGCLVTHIVEPLLTALKTVIKNIVVGLVNVVKLTLEEILGEDFLNEISSLLGIQASPQQDTFAKTINTLTAPAHCMDLQQKMMKILKDATTAATAQAVCTYAPEKADQVALALAVWTVIQEYYDVVLLQEFIQEKVMPVIRQLEAAFQTFLQTSIAALAATCSNMGLLSSATCNTIAIAVGSAMVQVVPSSISETAVEFIKDKFRSVLDNLGPLLEVLFGVAVGTLKVAASATKAVLTMDPVMWEALKPILNHLLEIYFPDIAAQLDDCNTIIEDIQFIYRRFSNCDPEEDPKPATSLKVNVGRLK